MFESKFVDHYTFDEVPLNRDLHMMSDRWIEKYDRYLDRVFSRQKTTHPGYIAGVSANGVRSDLLDLTWFPNYFTRFHRVEVTLPRSQFVRCVGSWQWDEDPHLFVKESWLEDLYIRPHCVFGFIDAIGIKQALASEKVDRSKLMRLRAKLDDVCGSYPNTQFISFADTLMFKRTYTVGHFRSKVRYTYEPEDIVVLFSEVNELYRSVLGLETYAIVTEGNNEFYIDRPIHRSEFGNHLSLNSFGAPFAQLLKIEHAVANRLHLGEHPPMQIYMDEDFFLSLHIAFEHSEWRQKQCPRATYRDPLTQRERLYYMTDREELSSRLRCGA